MDGLTEAVDLGIDKEMSLYTPAPKRLGENPPSSNINPNKLKEILEQKEALVCHKMHKAMSPISAISGYLELMKLLLDKGAEKESLKRYRDKVEEGVDELGEIVEELYEAFDNESGEAV